MSVIEKLKELQEAESPICPRCGRVNIKRPLHTNAMSRVATIYVCNDCGTDEALRDFAKFPLPAEEWFMAKMISSDRGHAE